MRVYLRKDDKTILEIVDDVRGDFNALLPGIESKAFKVLRSIDPYSACVIRPPDIERFIAEWDEITKKATTPRALRLMRKVREMAEHVRADPALALDFAGSRGK